MPEATSECVLEVRGCSPQQAAWLRAALRSSAKPASGWSARAGGLRLTFDRQGSAWELARLIEVLWEGEHPSDPISIRRLYG